MVIDTRRTRALVTEPPMKPVSVRKILEQYLSWFALLWFLQAKGKALLNPSGPDADLILIILIFNFCQEKLRTAVVVSKAAFQFAILTFAVLVQGLTQKLRAVPQGLTIIAVTGDGTNDAPELHEADIGLAMGIAGTESADSIILDDNFPTFVTLVQLGRSVYIDIQKFVQFQLTVNVLPLIVNFSSSCLTGNAPLTAVVLLTLGVRARKPMPSFFILLCLVFLLEIQAVDGRHLKGVSDVKVSLPPPSFPPTFSNQKEADTAPPPPSANHFIHP